MTIRAFARVVKADPSGEPNLALAGAGASGPGAGALMKRVGELGIATQPVTRNQLFERIIDAAFGYLHLLGAEFVAHVEKRRSLQCEKQHRTHARLCLSILPAEPV